MSGGYYENQQIDDERIIQKFLWLPKYLGCCMYWLETRWIKQYRVKDTWDGDYYWMDYCWSSKQEYEQYKEEQNNG